MSNPNESNSKPTQAVTDSSAQGERAAVLSSKLSFQGKVFSVTTDTVIEPGGASAVRDIVRHNGSIVVLAVDPTRHSTDPDVLIERQYRHAANQFLLELPAGSRDPGEAPLDAAKRELIEETGYRAGKWTSLITYYASPGFMAETMEIFLAEELEAGIAKPEADENIEVLWMPLSEVLKRIHEGRILDGKTVIGTLFYARFLS